MSQAPELVSDRTEEKITRDSNMTSTHCSFHFPTSSLKTIYLCIPLLFTKYFRHYFILWSSHEPDERSKPKIHRRANQELSTFDGLQSTSQILSMYCQQKNHPHPCDFTRPESRKKTQWRLRIYTFSSKITYQVIVQTMRDEKSRGVKIHSNLVSKELPKFSDHQN